jgi:hypothetical protein
MRAIRLLLRSVIAVLAGLILTATPSIAGTETTRLALASAPAIDENGQPIRGQLVISATLVNAAGQPLSNRTITFYEEIRFLGAPHEALLGTGITDATGTARVVYQPARTGPDVIIARFAGDNRDARGEARATLEITDVVPPFRAEANPLGSVESGLTAGFILLTAAVGLTLVGILLRTVLAIRAADATEHTLQGSPAPQAEALAPSSR